MVGTSLGINLEEQACKVGVGELEVTLVIELEQCRTVGMLVLQVQVVDLGLGGGVAAVLAHVHLKGGGTLSRGRTWVIRYQCDM